MPNYWVSWDIGVDADTPVEAAVRALAIQRDPESIATVFAVKNEDTDETHIIDLDPEWRGK